MNWLRKAGWWASDYAYAVDRQARATLSRRQPLLDGEQAPIVVLPGIYESWKFLLPLAAEVHSRGHPVHPVQVLGFNARPVVESAQHVVDYLERHNLTEVFVLAHSKGGLIGKHVMTLPAGERIRGMLAIATPFSGSAYARYMLTPSLRIFSPADPTIRALASEPAVNARIVSVYSEFDPHIPSGSHLAGARNVRLDTGGHFRILKDPRILDEWDELTAGM